MNGDCGTQDAKLIAICQSVPSGALILLPGGLAVDRPVALGESVPGRQAPSAPSDDGEPEA